MALFVLQPPPGGLFMKKSNQYTCLLCHRGPGVMLMSRTKRGLCMDCDLMTEGYTHVKFSNLIANKWPSYGKWK